MKKLKKVCFITAAVVLGVLVMLSEKSFAATSVAKQLEKGIQLYNQNKTDAAMDYFINVMVEGTPEQVATANQYVNKIHNQIGGIQTPVEVDVNFKEGAVRELDEDVAEAELQGQAILDEADNQLAGVNAAIDQHAQNAQQALDEIEAQQKALADQIEAKRAALQNQAQAAADGVNEAVNQAPAAAAAAATAATAAALSDENKPSILDEEADATDEQADDNTADLTAAAEVEENADENAEAPADETSLNDENNQASSSVFADLTSPEAVEARNLYTEQKLASMKQAAIEKITATDGVHLYMRDGQPDAIDIDDGVLFDKTDFRPEALPLLNNIYELLALQQGAQYVILPPGSYTDDVTLAGMREAAALNSYLVKRGISQGKLTYNMGLVEKEAPAQFANLKGLSVVFDYDAKLPTRMQQNENNETAPLLSMAIVPQCHAIDRSLGEAYAIDFSVLETVTGLDNWILQVVQHGRDGNYYIVRQLEGFSPVYHQILWNGRKGIIGPELPCGKYTIVLTATDLKGNKQTLRRRVVVKCSSQQSDNITSFCGVKEEEKEKEKVTATKELNYKTARLWKKPARVMGGTKKAQADTTAQAAEASTSNSTYTHTKTVTNIVTEDTSAPATTSTTTTVSAQDAYYGDMPADIPTTNPYAQPYDDLN